MKSTFSNRRRVAYDRGDYAWNPAIPAQRSRSRYMIALAAVLITMAVVANATPGDVKNPDGSWSQPDDNGWNDSKTGCHAGDCNPKPEPKPDPKPEPRTPERDGSGTTTQHDGQAWTGTCCIWEGVGYTHTAFGHSQAKAHRQCAARLKANPVQCDKKPRGVK